MTARVNFFLVGQPKSGTTALARFLDEHPEIAITVPKEPGYLATDHVAESRRHYGNLSHVKVATAKQYASTFAGADAGQLVGDATTWYLYSETAAEAIRDYNPEARIVMSLRDPIEMIRSLHQQHVNSAYEDIEAFADALEAEKDRAADRRIPSNVPVPSWLQYRARGLYYAQVKRYLDTFGADRVLVLLHEELRDDPESTYRRVLDFLGVKDTEFAADFRTVNAAAAPRSARLNRVMHANWAKRAARRLLGYRLMNWVRHAIVEPLMWTSRTRDPISPDLREELREFYREDVRKLGRLLGRDLESRWLSA